VTTQRLPLVVIATGFVFWVVFFSYGGPLMRAQQPPDQTPVTTPGGAPVVQVPGSIPAPSKESTPAVVTTTVPSPASPTHVPEQVMWALAMSYVMQFFKKQKWFPLLTPESTASLQAFIGFLVATATAAGIHIAVQGSMLDVNGLSFSVTGLTIDAIKDVGFQWVAQQGWYDALVKARPGEIRTA
jgi:hypothetical protein